MRSREKLKAKIPPGEIIRPSQRLHPVGQETKRVAMGRAIVRNPKVAFMDDTLSNLDANCVQMRSEIASFT